MPEEPLVSVGIPTYERARSLERAIDSALSQTYERLELVISDNASADGTSDLCEAVCKRDGRVRYLRQPTNRGPTANFNTLFAAMRGDFVMLLSDDDWLADDYVAVCLAELLARPRLVLAAGVGRYLADGQVVRDGRAMQLTQPKPAPRVLAYLADVDENGAFYGLMPRDVLAGAAPLRNVIANDWLLVAAIAAQGEVATLRSTFIYRELGGTSADIPKLAATLGLPRWQSRIPHLLIAWELANDILWRSRAYRGQSFVSRAVLALRAASAAIDWRSLAWHATMPAFAALAERRHGRVLWRAYERLTRLLGAGRSG